MKKISLLTFLLGSFFLLQAQPHTKHIAPIEMKNGGAASWE